MPAGALRRALMTARILSVACLLQAFGLALTIGPTSVASLPDTGIRTARTAPGAPGAPDAPVIYSAVVDGIIHPVSADFMIDTIDRADAAGASLVVFTLRTPGGLLDSTRAIVSRMIVARTPVAIFVAPSGARAASAGFILTIAADVAAMAPGTHIGAAHPVEGDGQKMDETLAKKVTEDLAAYHADAGERAASQCHPRSRGGQRKSCIHRK